MVSWVYSPGPIRVEYANKMQIHVLGDGDEVFCFLPSWKPTNTSERRRFSTKLAEVKRDIKSDAAALTLKSFTLSEFSLKNPLNRWDVFDPLVISFYFPASFRAIHPFHQGIITIKQHVEIDLAEQSMLWIWTRSRSVLRPRPLKEIHGQISFSSRKAVILQPWDISWCEIEEESLRFLYWNKAALIILTSAPRTTSEGLQIKWLSTSVRC